jgi:tetratricopeptide (TPR) repeat protein
LYANGEQLSDAGDYVLAREYLTRAVKISPNEAIYWEELATATSYIAQALANQEQMDVALKLAEESIAQSNKSVNLSPANVNIKRSRANVFVNLSIIDTKFLINTANTLEEAVKLAPTEPKLHFNLGLAYARIGRYDNAVEVLEKAVELKPDYRNARLGLGLVYYDHGDIDKAKTQLNYILENIDPNDQQVIDELSNF